MIWVELCAGAAATTLRLCGGPHAEPLVSWMGGKRRYASTILGAMGLQPLQRVDQVVLADAGPWGWVWEALYGGHAFDVCEVLRSWEGADPRQLWEDLASQPPPEYLPARVAGWLWLQARAASGIPVWWGPDLDETGSRMGEQPSKAVRGTRSASQCGGGYPADRWLMANGDSPPHAPGQKSGGWRQADHATGRTRPVWQTGSGKPPTDRGPDSRWTGGGIVHPETIAQRIERLPWMSANGREITDVGFMPDDARGRYLAPARIAQRIEAVPRMPELRVIHGDVGHVEPIADAFVYIDPPYVGCTGYGWDLPRDHVLELAGRWADAGAVVCVSEAEPLDLPGWHSLEITQGKRPEWLTLSCPPVIRPGRQLQLLTTGAPPP